MRRDAPAVAQPARGKAVPTPAPAPAPATATRPPRDPPRRLFAYARLAQSATARHDERVERRSKVEIAMRREGQSRARGELLPPQPDDDDLIRSPLHRELVDARG